MIALLLAAQISAAAAPDSIYASPALRDFVARAAIGNLAPPPELAGYRATTESELSFILVDSLGRETVGQTEQLAARAEWRRTGEYHLHIVGHRQQSLGSPLSALTFARMYSVPTLHGNRLYVGMNDGLPPTGEMALRRARRRARDSAAGLTQYRAVHPLAGDRDTYYRFSGGDTVAIVHSAGRAIRVVRVHVEPVTDPRANFVGFRGDLDFDADRHQLVRMRGTFMDITPRQMSLLARAAGVRAVAFVDFENVEVNGRYWLPAFQRTEGVVQLAMLGEVRPVFRLVTRFRNYRLDESRTVAEDDTAPRIPPTRARLTFAAGDSASEFSAWEQNLGTETARLATSDFDDLAPDEWRPTGRPTMSWFPRQLGEVVRYNRIEGMFTGASGTLRMRDAAPGVTIRGHAGWAWAEQTARGAGLVSLSRGNWIHELRAERMLATTNDWLQVLESAQTLVPLFTGSDDHDYVDRWQAGYSVTRAFRDIDRAALTLEGAFVRDRAAVATVRNSVFGSTPFRVNRNVFAGDYARGTATLEYHPRVHGMGLTRGLGARVRYEVAQGERDIGWQRLDVRVAARQYWKGLIFAGRVDAGAVTGDSIPPQALYEMGGGIDLPSYEYKEFAGDRVALGRGLVAYYFPFLRAPRPFMGMIVPGLSPGIGFGVQGGWTEISSPEAAAAVLALGGDGVTPISRETGRVRATADVRLTFLSGAIGVGMSRTIDAPGAWRPFFVWGAAF